LLRGQGGWVNTVVVDRRRAEVAGDDEEVVVVYTGDRARLGLL
jgi:hypothetical protein